MICAILIVVLPTLRLNSLSSNKSSSSFNLVNSIESFFGEFSALGKDSFIYKNFDSSNYWYGRNYLNIFTSFIPKIEFLLLPKIEKKAKQSLFVIILDLDRDGSPGCEAWNSGFENSEQTPC